MTLSAINHLQRLNRPKILVQAARRGVTTYELKSHLLHLFGGQNPKACRHYWIRCLKKRPNLTKCGA